MTGKGLLACIDLAWIGLALAGLVWFEAQPGIGGQVSRQSELLSSCVLALGRSLECQVRPGFGLNKSQVRGHFYF